MVIILYFILQMGMASFHYNKALSFSSAILFYHRLKAIPTWHSTCRKKARKSFYPLSKIEEITHKEKTLCIILTSSDIIQN